MRNHYFLFFLYKKPQIGQNEIEVINMPDNSKKDVTKKNKNKVHDGAKIGIAIAASATLFFGCIFAIGQGLEDEPVGGLVSNSTSVSSSGNSTSKPNSTVTETHDPLKETVNRPFTVNLTLSRPFYDASLSIEERMNAVVNLPGEETYFKSQGEDYSSSSAFDVYASFSGKVIKTENNTIYGNVVWIQHESGVVAIYASLGDIKVNNNQEVKQNEVIGKSGTSTYTQEIGTETLHFELAKDEKPLNPKTSYGQLVKDL